jgi:hypothetical protein
MLPHLQADWGALRARPQVNNLPHIGCLYSTKLALPLEAVRLCGNLGRSRSMSPATWHSSRARRRISTRRYRWVEDFLPTRSGRTLHVWSVGRGFLRRRLRLHGRRGRGSILAAIEELDAAVAAMIQFAAHPPFEQVQETGLHRVDPVALFQLSDAESAATRAAAATAVMQPVAPWSIFRGMALPAAVLRHEAEPLDKRTMHPAQLPAAPGTFLLHLYCYIPVCA